MKRILVIGAGGCVGSALVRRLKPAAAGARFTLADIEPGKISFEFMDGRTVCRRVDLFDEGGLSKIVGEHDVVLNCAGPFIKTAAAAARACVELGKDYLDLCDDIEALELLLPLNEQAVESGSRLLVGAGVSPGFTNVFAADLVSRFDRVEALDVAWLSGDEGGDVPGEAVLDHVLHIAGGEGVRWRNGAPERFESYTIPCSFPMGGGLGERTIFEVSHPEPLMLSRTFPEIPLIRCFGGIDPPAIGAVVRGVSRAVKRKKISRGEAIRFLQAASCGKLEGPGAWIHALSGIVDGLGDGMIRASDAISFAGYLFGRHVEFAGGTLCRTTGVVNGIKRTLTLRSKRSGPGTFIDSMANATGTCACAFTMILLSGDVAPGLHYPEELDPRDVYDAITSLGFPSGDVIDDVFEVATPSA